MPNHINVTGFHHVAIKVRDFDASVRFYAETLGFKTTYAWGEGDGRGALIDSGNGNYFEIFAGGPSEQPSGAWFHIAVVCTDTIAAIEKVRAAGITITMEPKDIVIASNPPLPARIAFFNGPDGESIELFQVEGLD